MFELSHLVFIHIPKTAGTSLASWLDSLFAPSEIFQGQTILDYRGKSWRELSRYRFFRGHLFNAHVESVFPPDIPRITVLRHPVDRIISLYKFWRRHPDDFFRDKRIPEPIKRGPRLARENRFAEFVRTPDQMIRNNVYNGQARILTSKRYFDQFPNAPIEEWLDDVVDNMARYLTVGTLDTLPVFIFRFITETGADLPEKLPVKNAAKADEDEQLWADDRERDETLDYLHEQNWLDLEIYERARAADLERASQLFSALVYQDNEHPTADATYLAYRCLLGRLAGRDELAQLRDLKETPAQMITRVLQRDESHSRHEG